MCGRFTLRHSPDQIALRFQVQETLIPPQARYNIAPSQPIAVVTQHDDKRVLEAYRWGLIPFWAKDPAIGNKIINARAETLWEQPAFKHALLRRRCLIPADGFYEWKKEANGRPPMYLHRKDNALFSFAGLWEEWKQADGTPLRSCTIITVPPNALVASSHDRMPAMLTQEEEALWLDPELRSGADLMRLLHPYPAEQMDAYAVSKKVNVPTLDTPDCLAPIPEGSSTGVQEGMNSL